MAEKWTTDEKIVEKPVLPAATVKLVDFGDDESLGSSSSGPVFRFARPDWNFYDNDLFVELDESEFRNKTAGHDFRLTFKRFWRNVAHKGAALPGHQPDDRDWEKQEYPCCSVPNSPQ